MLIDYLVYHPSYSTTHRYSYHIRTKQRILVFCLHTESLVPLKGTCLGYGSNPLLCLCRRREWRTTLMTTLQERCSTSSGLFETCFGAQTVCMAMTRLLGLPLRRNDLQWPGINVMFVWGGRLLLSLLDNMCLDVCFSPRRLQPAKCSHVPRQCSLEQQQSLNLFHNASTTLSVWGRT